MDAENFLTTMGIDYEEEEYVMDYLKETSDIYHYQFTVVMDNDLKLHILVQDDCTECLVSDEFAKAIFKEIRAQKDKNPLLPIPDICM